MADEVKTQNEKAPEEATTVSAEMSKRGRKKSTVTKTTPVKNDSKKSVAKKAGRKAAAKPDKKAATVTLSTKKTSDTELKCKSLTIEFDAKKFTEKDLYNKVQAYIKAHPYINAHEIEIFVKPNESCAYFTVDGYSNSDFKVEL